MDQQEYKRVMLNLGRPYPPCCFCHVKSFKHCRDTGKECTAFRKYCSTNTGKYKSQSLGKDKRMPTEMDSPELSKEDKDFLSK